MRSSTTATHRQHRGHRSSVKAAPLLACFSVLTCARAAAQTPLRLPEGNTLEGAWQAKAFPQPGTGRRVADCAEFGVGDDPDKGRCLVVGPWTSGRWSARAEYTTAFGPEPLEVRGWYRTEGLSLCAAAVPWFYYDAKGKRIGDSAAALGSSTVWEAFSVRIDTFPRGTAGVRIGFGLRHHTEGRLWLSGLVVRPADGRHPLAQKMGEPEITRPTPPPGQQGTGFFRTESFDGTWWLLDPTGQPFYSLATDGGNLAFPSRPAPGADAFVRQLRAWGFNSLAGWTNPRCWGPYNLKCVQEGQPPIPYWAVLNFHAIRGADYDMLTDRRGDKKEGEHGFPDPFDPRFREAARRWAREREQYVHRQPSFVGWFVDNEMSFEDLYRYVWSQHCAKALLRLLENRHPTIDALNERWGTGYESFDALAADKPEPQKRSGPVFEDFLAFERVLVKQYNDTVIAAVREVDHEHLVCSNRHMLSALPDWLRTIDLAAAYDVVAVNMYPSNRSPGADRQGIELLRMVHERTGRPLIIGEWSIPALDSGLYERKKAGLDWSWKQVVPTQTMRASQAAHVTAGYYNLPFVVGAHCFTWRDFDSAKREANRGLVRSDGTPYEELTTALTNIHRRIAAHGAQ